MARSTLVLGMATALVFAGCAPTAAPVDAPGGDDGKADGQGRTRTFLDLTFYGLEFDDLASDKARAGLQDLYAGRGFHNALPKLSWDAAQRLRKHAAAVAKLVGDTQVSIASPEGQFLAYGNLPSPWYRQQPSGVPLGQSWFDRDGTTFVNNNCFSCHAGVVMGTIVPGMANAYTDQVAQHADMVGLLKVAPVLKTESVGLFLHYNDAARQGLTDYLDHMESTLEPTFKYATSRGDNLGPFAVFKLLTRLADPANQGLTVLPKGTRTERDDLFDSISLVTVDPNPWWNRKYRNSSYWWNEHSPNVSAHFAFNFTTPHGAVNENHADHVAAIDDILAFAEQTTSPPYRGPVDTEKVALGADLFHGRKPTARGATLGCADCHGSYEKLDPSRSVGSWSVDYPNVGLVNVKTDPTYSEIARLFTDVATRGNQLQSYYDARGESDLTPQVTIPERAGYVPPVLVGAWASAPYFHNGSVPTLYGVLNSNARPAVWERTTSDPFTYDRNEVGLTYKALTPSEYGQRKAAAAGEQVFEAAAVKLRAIYDTGERGKSNAGHTYGDGLNDDERYAIIEFIKTLSGPDMPPASP